MLICYKWDVFLVSERKLIMNICYYMYMYEVFIFFYILCMFYFVVGKVKYIEIYIKLFFVIIFEIYVLFFFVLMKSLYIYIYIV